ncbi:MAG: peptide deformylase [Oscillospiraceae bacterium]|jgi:peptide deformylase|nr:peptide deformylase [Oscillospiraceae bacterium]
MALRKILRQGDKALLRLSRPVTDFDARLAQLLDDLHETIESEEGMGLAAPQVGVLRRACLVIDLTGPEDEVLELINPEIIHYSEELDTACEGCLSVPNIWGMVDRPKEVRVRAQDRQGNVFELDCDNYLARAIQHEIDHLDGVLFSKNTTRFLSEREAEAIMDGREREFRKRRKNARLLAAKSGTRPSSINSRKIIIQPADGAESV